MALSLKQRSVLPGFGLTMGFTLLYLSLIVLIALRDLPEDGHDELGPVLEYSHRTQSVGLVPAQFRRVADRSSNQHGLWYAGRLGARALQLSGQTVFLYIFFLSLF